MADAIVSFLAAMGWRGSFLLLLACSRLRKYDGNIPTGARRLSAERSPLKKGGVVLGFLFVFCLAVSLTACAGDGHEAAIPRITFLSDRDGNREIYLVNVDGTGLTNLTNNPALDSYPAWSPDGSRIAFVSNRDGNEAIYVMKDDGTNAINLTGDAAVDTDPSWSPDGSEIAFTSNRQGNQDLYVMSADGEDLRNLTNNPSPDYFPAWSPRPAIAFRATHCVSVTG